MKTTVKKLSDTKVQLTISLGASELADAEQVSLTKLARDIKFPGFRKGKVPASIAAKHIDPNALQEQILENALSKAVAEAFLQENCRLWIDQVLKLRSLCRALNWNLRLKLKLFRQ